MKILLIEDDEQIAAILSEMLTAHHYLVEHATDGKTGLDLAQAFTYDLIVLDLAIPRLDGLSVCQKLRKQGRLTPILVLTARDSEADKAQGLDAGADDYVCKPFNALELLARIRALIRRSQAVPTPSLTWERLVMHPLRGEVTYADQPLALTPKEFGLLELFLRNPQRIFSRSAILDQLWPYENPPSESAVTMHIKDLRQKLKAAGLTTEIIETIYGMGYRLKTAPNPLPPPAPSSPPAVPQAPSHLNTPRPTRSVQAATPTHIPPARAPQKSEPARRSPPPATPPPATPPPARPISLNHLLTRFHPHFIQQVTDLTVLVESQPDLFSHPPHSTLWQPVRHAIHKLTGTLGTFGYTTGSLLVKELDQILRQETTLSAAQQDRVKDLLSRLKQALDDPPTPQPNAQSPLPSVAATPKRVLILDRDRTFLDTLQAVAPTWQITVTIANNLAHVRQLLTQALPDLVLLALDLPLPPEAEAEPSDSLQLLQELTRQAPLLPVVILSQHDRLEDRVVVARIGGSCFLPRSTAIEHVLQTLYAVLHPPWPNAKILAVDDDPAFLAHLVSLLEPCGLCLTPLANPCYFWDVLAQIKPDFLILDLEMPTFSGLDLCQVIRQAPLWKHLPILILTSHIDAATIQRVFAAGADDFMDKLGVGPALVTRILNRLERVRQRPAIEDPCPEATTPAWRMTTDSWGSGLTWSPLLNLAPSKRV